MNVLWNERMPLGASIAGIWILWSLAGALPHAFDLGENLQKPADSAVSGVVLDGTSGAPLAGATVQLAGGGASQHPILTNTAGTFVFSNLQEAATYRIDAAKLGYFASSYPGQGIEGTPGFLLRSGHQLNGLRLVMWRQGSISGRIVNETGKPLAGIRVAALPWLFVGGERHIAKGPEVSSDSDGNYRISGLGFGSYDVAAWIPGSPSSTVSMAGGEPPRPTYSVTVFPNSPSVGQGQPVDLERGQSRSNIDFNIARVRGRRVSGSVVPAPDDSGELWVRLVPAGNEELGRNTECATARVVNGRFELNDVPPGNYSIEAKRFTDELMFGSTEGAVSANLSWRGIGANFISPLPNRRPAQPSNDVSGRIDVAVGARDIDDLVLLVRRNAVLTGQIVFDAPLAGGPPTVTIFGEPEDGSPTLGQPFVRMALATPQMSFSLEGFLPSAYFLRGLSPNGYVVKSVTQNGVDYTDRPINVADLSTLSGFIITLTNKAAAISGRIRFGTGATGSARPACVIAFPFDPALWQKYGFRPSRFKAAIVDPDGVYSLNGLPAGEYEVLAVDVSEIESWRDPTFLARAATVGSRVSVSWGARMTMDLSFRDLPK